ncbi:NurA domain protein [Archaeoglobus fulgidus DSM 8774]|uniref:NurA domain protein n=1 Tax=Archaeoglobus fulgidus DSM 8774 TaxID=1344584 RepID=A0A075WBT5_ARCFL|nr:DNA double-strand break repair nuclease NurA [Archaeoglobus fulgidus]AIG97421.1 NurA domain protein [Archaeoglobus fulgidus DSM 8774]
MPGFLESYIKELNSKSKRIRDEYCTKSSKVALELEKAFEKFWMNKGLPNSSPSEFSVLAVDSSSRHIVTSNGGIFYVVRALALSKERKYKELVADFDFTSDSSYDAAHIIHRKMEWLEHKVALQAMKDGFDGYILFDGSIYGRLAHIPIETGYVNDRAFMLKYFETVMELLETCREENIPIIGISKESRTAFFREFLIKTIASEMRDEIGLSAEKLEKLLSLAIDNRRIAVKELEKIERERDVGILRDLIEELFARRPDFQLILSYAETAGYTMPLMLGASIRWKRFYERMVRDPESFVRSNFPVSSRDRNFVEWALRVVENIPNLPAIVSFHLLPVINDTPMRIDIPAWVFGIEERLSEVGWPEAVNVDIDRILKLISAGYCGLENYNVWLKAVDDEVKLRRDVFENLYLPKFEEIVGRFATPRGYRRVRFP